MVFFIADTDIYSSLDIDVIGKHPSSPKHPISDYLFTDPGLAPASKQNKDRPLTESL
jgi:hypothetical protein